MKARVLKGGPGSGHHGHAGIPGHRGGSLPGSGSGGALDYVDTLTDEQRQQIERYTDDGYIRINSVLREKQGYPIGNASLEAAINELDAAIKDAPPIEHDVLYRVMRGSADANQIDLYPITDNAFVSTTYSEASLKSIMDHMSEENPSGTFTVFKIFPDKTARGMGMYVENSSTQPQEREVLLKREAVFDIMDMYQEGNIWYVEADLLDE